MRHVEHRAKLLEEQKQKVAESQSWFRKLLKFFQRDPLPYRVGVRSLTFPLKLILTLGGLLLVGLFFDFKYQDVVQALKTIFGLH